MSREDDLELEVQRLRLQLNPWRPLLPGISFVEPEEKP